MDPFLSPASTSEPLSCCGRPRKLRRQATAVQGAVLPLSGVGQRRWGGGMEDTLLLPLECSSNVQKTSQGGSQQVEGVHGQPRARLGFILQCNTEALRDHDK